MVDLRERIKQRGDGSSTTSEADQITETIHMTLKRSGSAIKDTASSKAIEAPAAAAALDVTVQSVAVSTPVAVPQLGVSRKEAVDMELCKPPGAPGLAQDLLGVAHVCDGQVAWIL